MQWTILLWMLKMSARRLFLLQWIGFSGRETNFRDVLKNFWRYTNVTLKILKARIDAQEQKNLSYLALCVGELVSLPQRLSVQNLLNPTGKDNVIRTISDDVLLATLAIDDAPEEEEEIDCENVWKFLLSLGTARESRF